MNRLIAEFMGLVESGIPNKYWTEKSSEGFVIGQLTDLKYDIDWNWLMKVVDKIESIEDGKYDVNILKNGTVIVNYGAGGMVICNNVGKIGYDEKIEHTYQAVIDFIKWHNESNDKL